MLPVLHPDPVLRPTATIRTVAMETSPSNPEFADLAEQVGPDFTVEIGVSIDTQDDRLTIDDEMLLAVLPSRLNNQG